MSTPSNLEIVLQKFSNDCERIMDKGKEGKSMGKE